jgi:hypothetical protein
MTRNRVLALAGTAAFALGLLAGLPAATALGWIGGERVRGTGIAGTLWRGSAATLETGNVRLGATRWRLSPLRLLTGRLVADVETRLGDGELRGGIAVGMSGAFACAGCSYEGPVSGLRGAMPALGPLDGRARIDVQALDIADGWPTRAVGNVRLSGVPITVPGAPPRRGMPTADFDAAVNADPVPADGLIEVAVQDAGGPVEFTARLSVTPPGNYELAGRAKARPDAPAEMVNALAVLGPRAGDGSTELSMSGSF